MLVGPARSTRRPQPSEIRQAMDELVAAGVTRMVTPAMNRYEAESFHQAGFVHMESLHLLSCHLDRATLPPAPGRNQPQPSRLVNGRRWHLGDMLRVDERAFHGFWQFDRVALLEARSATPTQLSRMAVVPETDGGGGRKRNQAVGYAVTGRAHRRGYLQRLAVDPDRAGEGIGTQLIHDAFRWLIAKGADTCLVNTQESNERALGLYEHLGFVRQSEGLVVLCWDRGA